MRQHTRLQLIWKFNQPLTMKHNTTLHGEHTERGRQGQKNSEENPSQWLGENVFKYFWKNVT